MNFAKWMTSLCILRALNGPAPEEYGSVGIYKNRIDLVASA